MAENNVYQVNNFLNCLNAVIHRLPLSLTEPIDYVHILQIAKRNNVFPLVYEKLCEDADFVNLPQFNDYNVVVAGAVIAQARRTEEFIKLYKAFTDNELYPIVMKGIICRQMYGDLCDHRPSGDEDLLIRKEDFDKAKNILESQGYKMLKKEITPEVIANIQEITFINDDNNMHIELHINPMGKGNDICRRMNNYFMDVFEDSIDIECNGIKFRTMSHTKHFLFLIFHAFRHFTSSGFGIRHAMDILMYKKTYGDKLNEKYIDDALRDIKAEKFYSDLVHIGNKYLGWDIKAPLEPKYPEALLEDMMQSGIFGNESKERITALTIMNTAIRRSDNEQNNSILKTYINTIFPRKSYMVKTYKELERKPWLLPICWVRRGFRLLRQNKGSSIDIAKESAKISKKRIQLLKKYDVI